MSDILEECFVNLKMQTLVSLDNNSIIKIMIEKFNNNEVVLPVKFKIIDVRTDGGRLTITIQPLDSFKLEDCYEEKQ